MQDHEQLALLLKSEAGFERIMELLLDKYRSYGEHRGKIDLHDASTIECEALNAFVSPKKFFKPPELSFKVSDFERAISESPYPNATLKAVLEAYFNQPIMTSSERNQRRQSLWEEFVGAISEKFRGTTCVDWLTAMFGSRKYGYHIVLTEYKADVRAAEALLSNVCRVVNARYACDFAWIQLAVLGADMTGDSHWFDSDRAGGKLITGRRFMIFLVSRRMEYPARRQCFPFLSLTGAKIRIRDLRRLPTDVSLLPFQKSIFVTSTMPEAPIKLYMQ